MLWFSLKMMLSPSGQLTTYLPSALGRGLCRNPISKPLFLSCCWTVVHGQGDDPGNIFTLQLTPPCSAFILKVLSGAACPISPHPPKILLWKRQCVQCPRTDHVTCGLAPLPRWAACLLRWTASVLKPLIAVSIVIHIIISVLKHLISHQKNLRYL